MSGLIGRVCLLLFVVISGSITSTGWSAPGAGATGSLLVRVIPRGAEVLIGNQVMGVAPLLIERVQPGQIRVRARMAGYRSWGKDVQINPMEKSVVTLILARSLRGAVSMTGTLEVRSDPLGARWTLDGVPSGVTPARVEGISAGPHRVGVELPGFGEKETEITIIGGESHQVVLRLASEGSRFWLEVEPAGATIRFEEKGLDYKPGMLLSAGRYPVHVSHPGYEPVLFTVQVTKEDWSGRVTLTPLKAGSSASSR